MEDKDKDNISRIVERLPMSAREFRQKHYVLPSSLDTYLKAEEFAEAYVKKCLHEWREQSGIGGEMSTPNYERWWKNHEESLAALRASVDCNHPPQFIGEWEDGSRHCWECEWYVIDAELSHMRVLLWRRHGCPNIALYGDDGEMQCSKCLIDFKRMSADDIKTRFRKIALDKLADSRKICLICGAERRNHDEVKMGHAFKERKKLNKKEKD